MTQFEKDLADVMGNFIATELDCVANQNAEIEKTQKELNKLKNILKNIKEIIEGSLSNVGRNEDCFEYYLGDVDCERILEMIPEFEELEVNND